LPKTLTLKKHITIPSVSGLQLAIVREFNNDFKTYDWNAYLINKQSNTIDMVLILSHGYDENKQTAQMRHKIDTLPANAVAKFEFLENKVLELNNSFKVTFFSDNQLFEKDFIIKKNSIKKARAKSLALFNNSKGFIFE
jgi:hypothetical protein